MFAIVFNQYFEIRFAYSNFQKGGDRLNNLKKMDLVFFSIISIIAELVTAISFANLSTGFYFSFAILIFIIFSIRWGNISIIALILSGIPLIFIQPIGNWQKYRDLGSGILYYMVVNVFAIIPIAIYGKRNRNKLISGPIILTLYVLCSVFYPYLWEKKLHYS